MAAQDKFQGGGGAILLHRRSWQMQGEKRVWIQAGSGASQSVPTLEQRRVYSKGEGKKKKKKKNFRSEKPQQQVEPSKTSSKMAGLSPRPISHLVKMPLCDVLPFPFKCSSSSPLTRCDLISFQTWDSLVSDAGTGVTVHREGDGTSAEQLT